MMLLLLEVRFDPFRFRLAMVHIGNVHTGPKTLRAPQIASYQANQLPGITF
jgi:hypothetical protein